MLGRIINIPLISQPLNWGIVLAVLLLAGWALTVTAEAMGAGNCGCNVNSDN